MPRLCAISSHVAPSRHGIRASRCFPVTAAHASSITSGGFVYGMVIHGFQNPVLAISYVIAQLFLGLHLYHAVPSMFQSVGLKHPRYNLLIEKLGLIVALVLVIGNVSMPLSILFGIVGTSVGG